MTSASLYIGVGVLYAQGLLVLRRADVAHIIDYTASASNINPSPVLYLHVVATRRWNREWT